jgi:predicted membrane protein
MNWARAFFGIIIVAVGSLLLLDTLDVLDAGDIIGQWWPVAIIAGGILAFLTNPRHWVVPLILVGGGGVVLLRTTGVINTLEVFLPAVLIVIGLLVLFGRGLGNQTPTANDRVSTFNLFSGSEIASNSKSFRGGRVGAIFGGSEIDLRDATLVPDAVLDVFAVFGGVEIYVPHGWRVEINGFPVFGGFENTTTKENLSEDAPRLRIDATVIFGGLEVRH